MLHWTVIGMETLQIIRNSVKIVKYRYWFISNISKRTRSDDIIQLHHHQHPIPNFSNLLNWKFFNFWNQDNLGIGIGKEQEQGARS